MNQTMRQATDYLNVTKKGVLSFGLLLLGACAGNNPNYVVSVPGEGSDSFESMAFKVLPAGKKVRLAIDSDDARFNFEGGYSYYEALSLPEMGQPYILQLESEVVRETEDKIGRIFFPVLTFLDQDKQKIQTFDALPYTLQTPFYGRNHILASVRVSENLSAARYVVIHTHDDKLDQAIATSDGKSLLRSGGFNTMIFAPVTEARYRIDFGSYGRIRLLAFMPKAG